MVVLSSSTPTPHSDFLSQGQRSKEWQEIDDILDNCARNSRA